MKRGITEICKAFWEERGKGTLLLGVSGGADSVALLTACRLATIPFEVAHCNFNLRDEESREDKHFVLRLCDRFSIPVHIAEFSPREQAEKGESIEMTCRRLRYHYFDSLLSTGNFSRLWIAHNADDNIETLFINLLRGSGTSGLKGMTEDNGRICRPLLHIYREEILEYLRENNQDYRTDSTNLQSDYRRNFIRNEVLPLIAEKWPDYRKSITRTISILRKENSLLQEVINTEIRDNSGFLSWTDISKFPDPETFIFKFISPFGGNSTIASEIIRHKESAARGKIWKLQKDIYVVSTNTGIVIENLKEEVTIPENLSEICDIRFPVISDIKTFKTPDNSEIYLPGDPTDYQLRYVTKNMSIRSLGLKGRQSVWKILKEAGLSSLQRSRFPVLTVKTTGEPVWLPGIKRAGINLIKGDENKIFFAKLKKNCNFANS